MSGKTGGPDFDEKGNRKLPAALAAGITGFKKSGKKVTIAPPPTQKTKFKLTTPPTPKTTVLAPKNPVVARGRSASITSRASGTTHTNLKFGSIISEFKTNFANNDLVRKHGYLCLKTDNIQHIVKLHQDCFDATGIKANITSELSTIMARSSAANDLYQALLLYYGILSNTDFKNDEAKGLKAWQQQLIEGLDKIKIKSLYDEAAVNTFLAATIQALKEVTKPEYTELLLSLVETGISKNSATATSTTPTVEDDEDDEDDEDLTTYTMTKSPSLSSSTPSAPDDVSAEVSMKRISKKSAMRKNDYYSDAKTVKLNTIFKADYADFTAEVKINDLFSTLQVKNLNLPTPSSKTHKTTSFESYDADLTKAHDQNKAELYADRYESVISSNVLKLKFKSNKEEVMSLKVIANAKNPLLVQQTVLTVSAAASNRYDTQAYAVEQLRKQAQLLKAKSVTIASVSATDPNNVIVKNVLKAAFNAVNANLVPRFDDKTWAALVDFEKTAKVYTSKPVTEDGDDAYLDRCLSKQFVGFLLSHVKPSSSSTESFEDVREGFTDLMPTLGYDAVYVNKRKSSR